MIFPFEVEEPVPLHKRLGFYALDGVWQPQFCINQEAPRSLQSIKYDYERNSGRDRGVKTFIVVATRKTRSV